MYWNGVYIERRSTMQKNASLYTLLPPIPNTILSLSLLQPSVVLVAHSYIPLLSSVSIFSLLKRGWEFPVLHGPERKHLKHTKRVYFACLVVCTKLNFLWGYLIIGVETGLLWLRWLCLSQWLGRTRCR